MAAPLDDLPNAAQRIATLALNFEQPNPEDSFRSIIEQVLEDVLVGGFGAIELDLTGDASHPLVLVAGGRRQHSHSHRLGRQSLIAALCAGHGRLPARSRHHAGR